MGQTVFSNGRNTFDTVIEDESIKLIGTATIGNTTEFSGQAINKDDNRYIGDYSKNNVSRADGEPISTLTGILTLVAQLEEDVNAKKEEVQA